MKRWSRTLPLLALAASTALVGPAGTATAAETPTASVGEVTCVEEDGRLTVTLTASDTEPATFLVLVDGAGDQELTVPAGTTQEFLAAALADGDHSVEVILVDGEEGETLLVEERSVLCDAAPDGPYANPRGAVMDSCEGTGWVTASNTPIGGNTEDLQPVTFTVSFTPTDEETVDPGDGSDGSGGGDDPVDGGDGEEPVDEDPVDEQPVDERTAAGPEVLLDTFVLDATTQTYERTFSAEELGSNGDLVLRVGEDVIDSGFVGECIVLAVENGAGGPAVVNTGA